MAPLTPQRKRLTNEQKLRIIEDSKRPGFCRKTTMDRQGAQTHEDTRTSPDQVLRRT